MRPRYRGTHKVWQHDTRIGATVIYSGSREECERFVRDSVLDDEQPDTWIDGDDNPLVDGMGVRVKR